MHLLSFALVATALSTAGASATAADACEALRAEIESRIRAAGVVSGISVTTVDAAANVPGEVVGTCNQGARKIVYLKNSVKRTLPASASGVASAPSARVTTMPAAPADQAILTECKPGFVSIRGDCKKL